MILNWKVLLKSSTYKIVHVLPDVKVTKCNVNQIEHNENADDKASDLLKISKNR